MVNDVTRPLAQRSDELVYWVNNGWYLVVLSQYMGLTVASLWYWVSIGPLCLFILNQVEIWSSVSDPSLTDFERWSYSAPEKLEWSSRNSTLIQGSIQFVSLHLNMNSGVQVSLGVIGSMVSGGKREPFI